MFRNVLNKLEDPKNPLLGPNLKSLKFWGIILPKNKTMRYVLYVLNFSMMFFVVTEYIDVWVVRSDIKTVLTIIAPGIKYLVSNTYRSNIKNGTEHYVEIIRSWVPLDKTQLPGYLMACSYQAYAVGYVSGYLSSFDTFAIVVMMFFKTEFLVLENDSSRIFDSGESIDDVNFKRKIKECHKRHAELFKYANLFNSCLSSIMFLYVVLCSVMLCAAAYETTIMTTKMSRFITLEYLTFSVAQLFMYCWHSNEVMVASQKLMMGPYKSMWYGQNKQHLRDLSILINQYERTLRFSAGPFTDLTVATFINILKGAYSYYTLIN
ncbi:odorant receptor 10-like [Battus philenor]|uniref:odorant receptor 10-like n=1 Tax=Battus philenor TaxID=42288 RepID=UPI0035D08B93